MTDGDAGLKVIGSGVDLIGVLDRDTDLDRDRDCETVAWATVVTCVEVVRAG